VPTDSTDLFLALTPELVLRAVEAGGLRTRPLAYPLNSFENRVYEVELEDRSRVIAKFYRPGRWSAAQIEEEHAFLTELEADELPVVPARPFPGGGTLRETEGILYALFERRGGRAPDELNADSLRRLGRLIARLHAVGARRPALHRLELTSPAYARTDLAWLESHQSVPEPLRERYFRAAAAICDAYDDQVAGVPFQRLHGDLHLGNLLLRDDSLLLVDFDDMMTGPPVQDLWLAVPGRDRTGLADREILLSGYEEMRDFDRATLALVEPLRGLRLIHYAGWLARRWHDPIFPRSFPHFGSEEYWREQTEDLEQQEIAIAQGWGEDLGGHRARAAEDAPASAEGEAELTNKDFFWDWEN
jgi:Ser/Thr protein kinase RdoA (MazF antagonist)